MHATDRIAVEQAFHDRQARERSATFARDGAKYRFDDLDYLNHETWIAPAFQLLGDLRDRQVLDFGCGHAMASVVMARRGANVTAFDLSLGYLDEAKRRAAANGVAVRFVQADGERLPFADCSFDRIWGNAILHHLDMNTVARETRRVLRPGGFAVFCEPWGENRLLEWARGHLSYVEKERTPDEEPLRRRHVKILRRHFAHVDVKGFQLLSMARRLRLPRKIVASLDWCDDMLLNRVPALQRYCRYVVLRLQG